MNISSSDTIDLLGQRRSYLRNYQHKSLDFDSSPRLVEKLMNSPLAYGMSKFNYLPMTFFGQHQAEVLTANRS